MISFKNITKIYNPKKGNKKTALEDISFELPSKGLIFLLGKSGSGKSTLLNILGTLDNPTKGTILINEKDITNFKEKELTSYRSTHIGFVFQEFNLLDDLNVYDNIDLSLNLKNIKSSKNYIDKYLDIVGLNNLGLRKIGELSGGEKQRVAIARALIKNPSIILADEPTGNLDSINSKQIFNLLKQISNERLVVVVSHDRDSANEYADGIIEIEDGKIIKNTINRDEERNSELKLNKSHISFFKRLKLAFGMLKNKKIRLAITIILLTEAFTLFGFSYSLMNFNISRTHAETLVHENEENVSFRKYSGDYFSNYNKLTDADLTEIFSKIDSEYQVTSYLISGDDEAEIYYGYNEKYNEEEKNAVYYHDYGGMPSFKKYSSDEINKLDIIGRVPTEAHEVLISQLLAETFLVKGYEGYNPNETGLLKYYNGLIDNIEELVDKHVRIDNTYITITGIIKDAELSEYEELKELSENKAKTRNNKLYEKFKSKYEFTKFQLVVTDAFFEKTKFEENMEIDFNNFKPVYIYNGEEFYTSPLLEFVSDDMEIYDGKSFKKISSLKDDEIIISTGILNSITNSKLDNEIAQAINVAKKKYDKEVKEREEKVKKQEEEMFNNPDYVYEEIALVEEVDYNQIKLDATLKFFNEQNILNTKVSLEIVDKFNLLNEGESLKYDFVIAGLSLDSSKSYTSYIPDSLSKYRTENEIVASVNIKESNQQKLEKLFNDFENINGNYKVYSRFTNSMNNISKVVESIEKIAKYITIGFLVFAVILFTMFTTSNLNVNKKKIGILRALGTKTKDIIKIFMLESSLIGLFTFVLAGIASIISVNIVNNYITKELFFYARPIIFNYESIIAMFIIVVIVIIISSILPIIKLAKTKPIDLISNR